MKMMKKAMTVVLILTTSVLLLAGTVQAQTSEATSTYVTKHESEVRATDIVKTTSYRWLWWTLGILLVVGGVAAAAGGGGGGGGNDTGSTSATSNQTATGSAQIDW